MKNEKKKDITVYIDNHFDLQWRRCFNRDIQHNGINYVSYGKIQEYFILDNIRHCDENKEHKFQIESIAVLDLFLKNNPQYEEKIQQLYAEGRLYIPGSGYSIIDTNLPGGESIIRNFVIGNNWMLERFGKVPKLATRMDAFGNCAQLPQILRGCGYDWVFGLSYSFCNTDYWRGLDGSAVYQRSIPEVGTSGGWVKYGPCPVCNGFGTVDGEECPTCHGRGIDFEKTEKKRSRFIVNPDLFGDSDCGIYHVGGEEILPPEKLQEWMDAYKEEYDIHFGFQEDAYEHLAEKIAAVNTPEQLTDVTDGELNPNNTGAYVTRIRTKTEVRRLEQRLQAVETLAAMAFIKTGRSLRKELNEVWKRMTIATFHDSIAGTIVDAAYDELLEVYAEMDKMLDDIQAEALKMLAPEGEKNEKTAVFNPLGHVYTNGKMKLDAYQCALKDVQKEEKAEKRRLAPEMDDSMFMDMVLAGPKEDSVDDEADNKETYVIENHRYRITADKHGLTEIFDKKLNRVVSAAAQYRPGEFVLEHDEGSPWATLYPHQERTGFAAYTYITEMEKSEKRQTLRFEVSTPLHVNTCIDKSFIQYQVTLEEDSELVGFEATVDWHNFNNRLRVAFPTGINGKHMYEVPYGYMERGEYEPFFGWTGAGGDWAAANWFGIEGEGCSVAFMNKGAASCKIEDNTDSNLAWMSLLRSPAVPTYLHEPSSYHMNGWDGMRDEGLHHFEYAFASYDKPFSENNVCLDAENYNALLVETDCMPEVPVMPTISSENVRIACVKIAEDEKHLVVRLAEYKGRSGAAKLHLPENIKEACVTNLMENPVENLEIADCTAELTLRAFEIKTIKFTVK